VLHEVTETLADVDIGGAGITALERSGRPPWLFFLPSLARGL
jgi:hypothetical protein